MQAMSDQPEYDELDDVAISMPDLPPMNGYVIGRRWQPEKERWVYKVSVTDPEDAPEVFDNWLPAHWLARR